jgi:hypothetical protein
MPLQAQLVLEKLELLSPERLAEVEDFIDFLCQRDTKQQLKKDFTQASEPALAKVWDNEEDAIYDHV